MNNIEPMTYQSLIVDDIDELNFETYQKEVEQMDSDNLLSEEEVVAGMVEHMVITETTKQMKRMQESLKEALEDV